MRKKLTIVVIFLGIISVFLGYFYYEYKLDRIAAESHEEMQAKEHQRKLSRKEQLSKLFLTLPSQNFKNAEILNINTDIFERMNLGERITIVFLGDSTTEQNYQTNGEPVHVGIIENQLKEIYKYNLKVINSGVSGNSIKEMKERLQTDVINHSPDLVVINSGLNDIRIDLTNEEFEDTYREVIEEIQDNINADIILRTSNVTISSYERLETDMNPIIKQLASEYELGFIDLYQHYKNVIEQEGIEKYNNDNVHPNEHGQKLIADLVLYSLISSNGK